MSEVQRTGTSAEADNAEFPPAPAGLLEDLVLGLGCCRGWDVVDGTHGVFLCADTEWWLNVGYVLQVTSCGYHQYALKLKTIEKDNAVGGRRLEVVDIPGPA